MHQRIVTFIAVVFMILSSGCSDHYPESLEYEYSPYTGSTTEEGEPVHVPDLFPGIDGETAAAYVNPYFGTPRHPTVGTADSKITILAEFQRKFLLTESQLAAAKQANPDVDEGTLLPQLTSQVLERGSQLYRRLCMHCHGINGDGNGPTGKFLNPRPRDFRGVQGNPQMKFISTEVPGDPTGIAAPSRTDLLRTIRNGIPSASMPSFNLLSDEELNALVSYVIHLSIRGIVQYQVALDMDRQPDLEPEVQKRLRESLEKWMNQQPVDVHPPDGWYDTTARQELIDTGKKYYLGLEGGCVECHGIDGRADPNAKETKAKAKLLDKWGYPAPPRNLTLGWYRGGSRPIDLFYRIKVGIGGTAMTSISRSKGMTEAEFDKRIWAIVAYIMSLPRE